MKKVLMIIAQENFRDEELLEPKEVLENKGFEVKIASEEKRIAKGKLGTEVMPDLTFEEINLDEFEGIIFVGGRGIAKYFFNQKILNLAKEAVEKNIVMGAICIAPSILANAGVLAGKRATAFPSEKTNLEAQGVHYSEGPVEVDGKIVTANGPKAAKKFGEKVALLLK